MANYLISTSFYWSKVSYKLVEMFLLVYNKFYNMVTTQTQEGSKVTTSVYAFPDFLKGKLLHRAGELYNQIALGRNRVSRKQLTSLLRRLDALLLQAEYEEWRKGFCDVMSGTLNNLQLFLERLPYFGERLNPHDVVPVKPPIKSNPQQPNAPASY
jgi:hypothetical protein